MTISNNKLLIDYTYRHIDTDKPSSHIYVDKGIYS